MNEDELHAHLAPLGFELIQLERLSWVDQVALFKNAKEIIAPHGAGLSNVVFCDPGTLVIELFRPEYVHWCYWHLASQIGARYTAVCFPRSVPPHHDREFSSADIVVEDPNEIVRLRDKLLKVDA